MSEEADFLNGLRLGVSVANHTHTWWHNTHKVHVSAMSECTVLNPDLLEEVHGLLDPPVQLPRPHDPARHGRQVPADGGVQLLPGVGAGHHLDVPAVVLQDVLVLVLDAQVWDAQPARFGGEYV